jgi:hypothetical protein
MLAEARPETNDVMLALVVPILAASPGEPSPVLISFEMFALVVPALAAIPTKLIGRALQGSSAVWVVSQLDRLGIAGRGLERAVQHVAETGCETPFPPNHHAQKHEPRENDGSPCYRWQTRSLFGYLFREILDAPL